MTSLAAIGERAAAAHVPLQVLFEVTERCHLDCVHCYLDVKRPRRNELSLAEIETLLDGLRDTGALFLTITGGEAFLRPDLMDILWAARRRAFAVRLFTSGTLLRRSHVAELARIRPVAVELSLYGMHRETHERVTRRKGSLRRTLRAAVMLRQAGIPVLLKTPLLHGDEDAYAEVIEVAERIGAGYRVDPSVITRRDGGCEPLDERPSVEAIARVYADPRLGAASAPLPTPRSGSEAPCAIARRVVRIAPNGDVHPCSTFPLAAGNVRETPFPEIWRESPLLRSLRGITLGDLHGACDGCGRQGYCARCSAQALLEHDDVLGPSAEACDRAEARELAAGVAPPPNAHRIDATQPLGRRPLAGFVPLSSLRRNHGHQSPRQ